MCNLYDQNKKMYLFILENGETFPLVILWRIIKVHMKSLTVRFFFPVLMYFLLKQDVEAMVL